MTHSVTAQEIIIILATQGQTPSVINADFLAYSGIVPEDWQLSHQPVYTEEVAQMVYQNQVSVVAQANRIVVAQAIKDIDVDEILAPAIARKLVQALPKVNYQASGFNVVGYVPFADNQASMYEYLNQTLLAPGPWQKFNDIDVEPAFEFVYNLPQGRLSLSAREAILRQQDAGEETTPIISFSGTVEHILTTKDKPARLSELIEHLDAWEMDLKTYTDLVNNSFLKSIKIAEPAVISIDVPVQKDNELALDMLGVPA